MKLYFATQNKGKQQEVNKVLLPYGIEVVPLEIELEEAITGTIRTIAEQKLAQAVAIGVEPIMVEDSGLFLTAYPKFPGILSKRIFERIGYRGFEKLLVGEKRTAWFEGVIGLAFRGKMAFFHAKTEGSMVDPFPPQPQPEPGLPFDPIFIPDGETKVTQQLSIERQMYHSYRRKALEQMIHWMKEVKDDESLC
ncbi:dITPase [Seinonella peptonophila]|uniref:DITPase n=1 Tax=Seinonella peptonophila TaxID=112248 RepID=A0A1M4XPB9_9BACL|nr:non-canonical purine NTP pyrophosphatase [Seinonella peptonophila]SHE95113.1 dITPase [Seinonella peptonophila]